MESKESRTGKLFVVSTPIGNKDDITVRAMNVLKRCDFILCEEMKEGAKLLKNINLEKDLYTLNEQNEIEQTLFMLDKLENGARICLISDCGTPVFADPGYHLVKAAIKANIEIEVVPGVSSIMTALVRSGMDITTFMFAGFIGRKEEEREFDLTELSKFNRTIVVLETPYRFNVMLEMAAKIMPERNAYIGMNLTMPYETHHYGTFSELYEKFKDENVKAEFVLCFEGDKENTFATAADRFYKSTDRFGDPNERKPFAPRDRKPFGDRDRDRKPYGDRGDRPKPFRRFDDDGDRKPFDRDRKPFGDRDRKPFDRDSKPYGDRDRKPFDRDSKPYGDRDRKPFDRDSKPYGDRDRKPFDRDSKPYGDRDRKPFDRDSKPYGDRDRKPFGDRDRKPFGDRDRKPFGDRDSKPYGDRDRKPFGDRDSKPYGDRDRKPFGDRDSKPFGDRDRKPFDRDKKSFGDKKRSGGGGFKKRRF